MLDMLPLINHGQIHETPLAPLPPVYLLTRTRTRTITSMTPVPAASTLRVREPEIPLERRPQHAQAVHAVEHADAPGAVEALVVGDEQEPAERRAHGGAPVPVMRRRQVLDVVALAEHEGHVLVPGAVHVPGTTATPNCLLLVGSG